MKHSLLMFCFCSAMAFAQTNQSVESPGTHPNSSATRLASAEPNGPFLRHLKSHNSRDWNGTKKVAAKVAEGTGKATATVAVIPAIPVYFVALFIHCSFHDCAAS